ncbi:hypothetical protein AKJ09_00411 [Labilithrix luteola]|uniref:Uncharacterized protein n=1 Tax=Labilithrix luteola TaxID=1391654 RepID=A0A0K1PJR2_9BACT|nr:tetratricopeptide repeat protein [Labilithrix luteola]AKU93747.1 hypothetical protein AKJ09_00411 [Labilithrix luteola]
MDRRTVLQATQCDPKRLPLQAVEAFFLSQVDGCLTLEEIAEIAGTDVNEAIRLAQRLSELGAVALGEPRLAPRNEPRRRNVLLVAHEVVSARRPDPRAEEIEPRRSDPRVEEAVPRPEKRRSSRKSVRSQRAASAANVPRVRTPIPRRTSKTLRADARASNESPSRGSKPAPSTSGASPAPASERRKSVDRLQRINAAKEIRIQARVDLFVSAAEAALRSNDVVSAANNYRLALADREDPILRRKLEELDTKSKTLRYERSVLRARAAEKERRWTDAATLYASAHDAKPDAAVAERAAHALRMGNGDLQRAMTLAEQAVAMASKNVDYRVTLAEVCLAANQMERAAEESQYLLELAPKDARAKDLAARVSKLKKSR